MRHDARRCDGIAAPPVSLWTRFVDRHTVSTASSPRKFARTIASRRSTASRARRSSSLSPCRATTCAVVSAARTAIDRTSSSRACAKRARKSAGIPLTMNSASNGRTVSSMPSHH